MWSIKQGHSDCSVARPQILPFPVYSHYNWPPPHSITYCPSYAWYWWCGENALPAILHRDDVERILYVMMGHVDMNTDDAIVVMNAYNDSLDSNASRMSFDHHS